LNREIKINEKAKFNIIKNITNSQNKINKIKLKEEINEIRTKDKLNLEKSKENNINKNIESRNELKELKNIL